MLTHLLFFVVLFITFQKNRTGCGNWIKINLFGTEDIIKKAENGEKLRDFKLPERPLAAASAAQPWPETPPPSPWPPLW